MATTPSTAASATTNLPAGLANLQAGAILTGNVIGRDTAGHTLIRTANGVPFASPNALFGLSRLSVWWLRLGIEIERIKPGNPQQNGRHERMHGTLKAETARPPAASLAVT